MKTAASTDHYKHGLPPHHLVLLPSSPSVLWAECNLIRVRVWAEPCAGGSTKRKRAVLVSSRSSQPEYQSARPAVRNKYPRAGGFNNRLEAHDRVVCRAGVSHSLPPRLADGHPPAVSSHVLPSACVYFLISPEGHQSYWTRAHP